MYPFLLRYGRGPFENVWGKQPDGPESATYVTKTKSLASEVCGPEIILGKLIDPPYLPVLENREKTKNYSENKLIRPKLQSVKLRLFGTKNHFPFRDLITCLVY